MRERGRRRDQADDDDEEDGEDLFSEGMFK
jgi:hypothetical protein